MATLVEMRKGRMTVLGEIPPELVGKVTSEAQMQEVLATRARRLAAEAKAAERQVKAAIRTSNAPDELQAMTDEQLAVAYEETFGRKPGVRKRETILEELADAPKPDGGAQGEAKGEEGGE